MCPCTHEVTFAYTRPGAYHRGPSTHLHPDFTFEVTLELSLEVTPEALGVTLEFALEVTPEASGALSTHFQLHSLSMV